MPLEFWETKVTCAHCGAKQVVEKEGAIYPGWIGMIIIQKLPAVAKTLDEALTEQARYQRSDIPVCSEACGAKLLAQRALELARTTAVRETLAGEFRAIAEGKPN